MIIEKTQELPHLTDREVEILELAAHGLTSKEIAQRITIAPRTVERHIENARLKMRARNRVHMISKAIAAGILTIEENSLHRGRSQFDSVRSYVN